MIRVLCISRINLLSSRTNVYNIVKTCEAINAEGDFEVKFITTDQKREKQVFFRKMGIQRPFDIICLSLTDTGSKYVGKRWYEPMMFFYVNLRLVYALLGRLKEFDVIYFRDESLFPTAFLMKVFFQKGVFFEIHSVVQKGFRQVINVATVKLADGVIAISSGLKRHYQEFNENILLSFCSADEDSWFNYSKDKHAFRRELGLPKDSFLIGYTGVVGANPNNDYYEVDDIVRSLVSLPEDILCVIVGEIGGNADWLRGVTRKSGVSDQVIILPWQDRKEIPKYLQAFDVILIPKRKKDLIGDSPAKMFSALSAQRPIIAGRADSIEEVLTDDIDAVIVEKNSPEGWSQAILKIYNDSEFAKKIFAGAWITKDKYTWPKRGIAITKFIKKTVQQL